MRRHALRKRIFWHALQYPALDTATCFHATAQSEYEDIRRSGFKQPVYIIPNGIDVPPFVPKTTSERKKLLFLGRIHPTKGVDMLLHAWKAVAGRFPAWELQVIGPDNEGYLAEMKMLAEQLRLERIVFGDPLYGEDKWKVYRAASLFVLPTHSENFGITVAESLAAGTPTIVTRGAPWGKVVERNAGWWIEVGIEPLIACLEIALAMPSEQLDEMGRAGREWMQQEYSWNKIALHHLAAYRWILNGGAAPPWICLN